MKPLRLTTALSTPFLLAAILAAPVAAQTASVHALIKGGETLSNGGTVTGITAHGISEEGTWAAIVRISGVAGGDRSLLINGNLATTEGSMTAAGEVIEELTDVKVSRDGTVGVLFNAANAAAPSNPTSRLVVGQSVVLSEGDTVPIAGFSPGDRIDGFYGFDIDGDQLAVGFFTRDAGGSVKRALLRGSVNGSTVTFLDAVIGGAPLSNLVSPFFSTSADIDVATSGNVGATIVTLSGAGLEWALFYNGMGVGEQGQAGAAPNSTWTFDTRPRIRVNRFNNYAVSGTIELSNGSERGALYRGSQPIAIEGGALNGVLGQTVGSFRTANFEITDDNEMIFTIPFSSGQQRLMMNTTTLVNTGTTQVDGEDLISLFATATGRYLSSSHTGDAILLSAVLSSSGSSLLLIEPGIANPTTCTPAPNSTGVPGQLDAVGSRYLSVNDLTMVASDLPADSFGYLLTSRDSGFVASPAGSSGNLCLGGAIGRFLAQVQSSGPAGTFSTTVDVTGLPQPMSTDAAVSGETWYFQAWHRDSVTGMPTSNFTDSLSVEFR